MEKINEVGNKDNTDDEKRQKILFKKILKHD